MKKIEKILAPTDLSDASRAGVRSALELAQSLHAQILVLHVIGVGDDWMARHDDFPPVSGLLDERKRRLGEFLQKNFADVSAGLSIKQEVELGLPYKNIVEKAESDDIDLIVMSTHGRTGLNHMILGSDAEKVVARAPCPVLVVPRHERHPTVAKAA
jgi:nucleotide-binding universal stress UspA family protein